MRLLHATTLEFEVFHDNQTPPYLILSHTWGNEEVTYQEMRFLQQRHALPDNLKSNSLLMAALEASAGLKVSAVDSKPLQARSGYQKIQKTAELAKEKGLGYFWVDTCCIDKSSSAELQEAINSMYRWYQQSSFCAAYLEDANHVRDLAPGLLLRYDIEPILRASRWITRGWTLQELIAPSTLVFFGQNWARIGSKDEYCNIVAKATGIPSAVLSTGDLSQASVAQKMSWAANRTTTRMEDRAYSLMGLFGIHMPMLYGEGDDAFKRLQEEIIRRTPDDSIFAWRAAKGSISSYSGLLAKSPNDFERSECIEQGRGKFATSNLGLKIETRLLRLFYKGSTERADDLIFALPLSAKEKGKTVALLVRQLELPHYTRVAADAFTRGLGNSIELKTLYFEQTPQIPKSVRNQAIRYYQFNFDSTVY